MHKSNKFPITVDIVLDGDVNRYTLKYNQLVKCLKCGRTFELKSKNVNIDKDGAAYITCNEIIRWDEMNNKYVLCGFTARADNYYHFGKREALKRKWDVIATDKLPQSIDLKKPQLTA